MNHKNKSKIKASCFKSAFIIGDKVVTTSFGKGNTAILEKEVTDDVVKIINKENSNYDLKIKIDEKLNRKKYAIKGRWLKQDVTGDDPRENSVMNDDNIHIQLIYNIHDIKKVLSPYINNIVYSLNNLAHKENFTDFIGMLKADSTLEMFKTDEKLSGKFDDFMCSINPYLEYHPAVFFEEIKKNAKNKNKTDIKPYSDDDLFSLFRILSDVRQSCVHGANSMYTYDMTKNPDTHIKSDTHIKEKCAYLDKMYYKKVQQVNDDFIKTNKTNLNILFNLYNAASIAQKSGIINTYYDFVIIQESKNLGFSIKEIREIMIEKHLDKLKEKGYNSFRGKMYTLIDFILYRYYTDDINAVTTEEFVNSLRASISDEERSELYNNQCNTAFKALGSMIDKLITDVNAGSIKNLVKEAKNANLDIDISAVKIQSEATYFVKTLYVLTLFLDGKEINELISSLINKFDNIASFISVMKDYGISCEFTENYRFFENSDKISRELRTLKSFARMKIEIPKMTNSIYADAVYILGLKDKNNNLILEYNNDLTNYLYDYVNDKLLDSDNDGKTKDTKLRNFLINNVIKSRRFWYVIRYINPRSARRIMNNSEIVKFILNRLPDEQIRKYYESVSCKYTTENNKKEQLDFLCDAITKMNINRFEDVPQSDPNKNVIKERYKAVIGLYLTVLYLFTKNLVKINSRYTTACCCLERDCKLHGLAEYNKGNFDYSKSCEKLLEKALEEKWINKRYRGYFSKADKGQKNMGSDRRHYSQTFHNEFRNKIVHLNAVMDADKYIDGIRTIDSYFMIYHYIMQRCVVNENNAKHTAWLKQTPAFKAQYNSAIKHNTYSKNIVKGLCLPFGYNLSRFKNLTVMEVFNRQEIMEEKKKYALENTDNKQLCQTGI